MKASSWTILIAVLLIIPAIIGGSFTIEFIREELCFGGDSSNWSSQAGVCELFAVMVGLTPIVLILFGAMVNIERLRIKEVP